MRQGGWTSLTFNESWRFLATGGGEIVGDAKLVESVTRQSWAEFNFMQIRSEATWRLPIGIEHWALSSVVRALSSPQWNGTLLFWFLGFCFYKRWNNGGSTFAANGQLSQRPNTVFPTYWLHRHRLHKNKQFLTRIFICSGNASDLCLESVKPLETNGPLEFGNAHRRWATSDLGDKRQEFLVVE